MAKTLAALPESSSFLLDVIRFSAALLVVIGHLSRPEFLVVGTRDLQYLGDFAVPVFFVLSGFVIRYVTVSREHTLRVYLIDRASRIYSVALPAMALAVGVAVTCFLRNRLYFDQQIAPYINHAALRVALNLTFLSQAWGLSTVQFADSPFWSLSYECLYYVAYGLFFYLRGARRALALLVLAVITGPQILFLFPIWLLGCAVYDLYQRTRGTTLAVLLRRITLGYLLVATASAAFGHPALLRWPIRIQHAFAVLPNPLELAHLNPIRATMLAIINGAFAAVGMFLLLLLADRVALARNHRFAKRFRHLADGTFSIYLMHYPLMMLARSEGFLRPGAEALNTVTMIIIVLLLIGLAAPLDRLKTTMRYALRKVPVPSRALAPQPASQPVQRLQETRTSIR